MLSTKKSKEGKDLNSVRNFFIRKKNSLTSEQQEKLEGASRGLEGGLKPSALKGASRMLQGASRGLEGGLKPSALKGVSRMLEGGFKGA